MCKILVFSACDGSVLIFSVLWAHSPSWHCVRVRPSDVRLRYSANLSCYCDVLSRNTIVVAIKFSSIMEKLAFGILFFPHM